jgi:hypothetical protein
MTSNYTYLLYSTMSERVAYLVLDHPIAVGDILTLTSAPRHEDDIFGTDQPGVYEVLGPVYHLIEAAVNGPSKIKLLVRKIGDVPAFPNDNARFRYIDKWKATPPSSGKAQRLGVMNP